MLPSCPRPDAAFIAVNRHAAVEVAQSLSAMGAGGPFAPQGLKETGAEGWCRRF